MPYERLSVAEQKFLWAAEPKNYTGAAITKKWVSMKNYAHCQIIILVGAWAAGTAAVSLKQATAVAGTAAKTLSFTKQFNDEAAGGGLVETAVVSDTFNLSTASVGKIYVIEVPAESLDVANGFDCLALDIASPGANADFYGAAYILSGARYRQSTPPDALVD